MLGIFIIMLLFFISYYEDNNFRIDKIILPFAYQSSIKCNIIKSR